LANAKADAHSWRGQASPPDFDQACQANGVDSSRRAAPIIGAKSAIPERLPYPRSNVCRHSGAAGLARVVEEPNSEDKLVDATPDRRRNCVEFLTDRSARTNP
jgi:hypothetical protein